MASPAAAAAVGAASVGVLTQRPAKVKRTLALQQPMVHFTALVSRARNGASEKGSDESGGGVNISIGGLFDSNAERWTRRPRLQSPSTPLQPAPLQRSQDEDKPEGSGSRPSSGYAVRRSAQESGVGRPVAWQASTEIQELEQWDFVADLGEAVKKAVGSMTWGVAFVLLLVPLLLSNPLPSLALFVLATTVPGVKDVLRPKLNDLWATLLQLAETPILPPTAQQQLPPQQQEQERWRDSMLQGESPNGQFSRWPQQQPSVPPASPADRNSDVQLSSTTGVSQRNGWRPVAPSPQNSVDVRWQQDQEKQWQQQQQRVQQQLQSMEATDREAGSKSMSSEHLRRHQWQQRWQPEAGTAFRQTEFSKSLEEDPPQAISIKGARNIGGVSAPTVSSHALQGRGGSPCALRSEDTSVAVPPFHSSAVHFFGNEREDEDVRDVRNNSAATQDTGVEGNGRTISHLVGRLERRDYRRATTRCFDGEGVGGNMTNSDM